LLRPAQLSSSEDIAHAASFIQNFHTRSQWEVTDPTRTGGSLDRISLNDFVAAKRQLRADQPYPLPRKFQRALWAARHCGAGNDPAKARAYYSKARRTFSLLLLWQLARDRLARSSSMGRPIPIPLLKKDSRDQRPPIPGVDAKRNLRARSAAVLLAERRIDRPRGQRLQEPPLTTTYSGWATARSCGCIRMTAPISARAGGQTLRPRIFRA